MSDAAIERGQPSTVTEGDGEQMSVHDLTMAEQVGLIHQVAGSDGNTVLPEEMIGKGDAASGAVKRIAAKAVKTRRRMRGESSHESRRAGGLVATASVRDALIILFLRMDERVAAQAPTTTYSAIAVESGLGRPSSRKPSM